MLLSIKKFFDTDEDDFGGGVDNPFADAKPGDLSIIEESEEQPAPELPEETPAKVEEKPAEPAKADEKPAEDAKPAKPAEPAKPADDKTVVEPTKVPETPKAETKPEVKKDKWEALKELGLDDFEIGLLKYREATGDLTPYLEAKTVDYSKMTDEQIMKLDLKNQYKSLTNEELELLYESEINERFKLDEELHEAAASKLGRLKMKLEADKIRQSKIDEQAKFKAPEKPVDDTAQRQQQEQEAKYAEYKEFVNSSDSTKALLKDKKLVYGSGETAFNFSIEKPESLVETALNPNLLFNDLVDKNGNADLAKVYKAKAYIANMEKIEQLLIDHGKTLGEKKSFEELQNPSVKPPAPVVPSTDMTPEQALARGGKVTGG